jgi:hypothetical protein
MISAFTATIPQRVRTLKKSIASILPQVDSIQVVLNNFNYLPNFLKRDKITCVFSNNKLEDGSRFKNIQKAKEFVLVFDDDIEYPGDYVSTMRMHHKALAEREYNPPVIVAPMGKVLKPRPIAHYYQDIEKNYKTFSEIDDYHLVDVPGACGILWSMQDVKITEDIVTPDIHHSDICVAKFAKQNGIQCYVVPHASNWLKNLMPEIPQSPTIFGKYRRNDSKLTDFVNKYL